MPADHYVRYERLVVPAFAAPFFAATLAPVIERTPASVIDLACGTGATARAIRRALPGAAVAGVDADPWAVRYARQLTDPSVAWLAGSASALPFATGTLDAVVAQQGAQFFPDVDAACRELRRVLAPGGTVSLLSWTADGVALFGVLDEALAEVGLPSPQYARPLALDLDSWLGSVREADLAVRLLDTVEAPFLVDDIDALVAHFIEPTEDDSERACTRAAANARELLESGDKLRAVRLVLTVES